MEVDVSCKYDVQVKIMDELGTSSLLDFHNHSVGLCVERFVPPEDTTREARRAVAPRVNGDSLRAWAYDTGVASMIAHVHGSSWGEQEAVWQAARAVYKARTRYILEVVLDGATYRYRAERPFSVLPAEVSHTELGGKIQTYVVRWRVQPDYTVGTVS